MNLNSDNLEPSTLQFKCFCEVFAKVVNLIYVPGVYCHVIILVVHLETSSKLKIKKENILSLLKVICSYNANQAGSTGSKVEKKTHYITKLNRFDINDENTRTMSLYVTLTFFLSTFNIK